MALQNGAQESTTVPVAKSRAQVDRLKAEAKLEESLQTLDSLVADAALIHLELDITRKNIEKAFEYLTSQQSRSPRIRPAAYGRATACGG